MTDPIRSVPHDLPSRRSMLRRRPRRGLGVWVLILFAIAAIVGIAYFLSSSGGGSSSQQANQQGGLLSAATLLSDFGTVSTGFASVVAEAVGPTNVSFNGVPNTADVLPNLTTGPVCLSAAGAYSATASDCGTVQASTVANYQAQIFSSDVNAGGIVAPHPATNLTNSTQDYIYTALRLEDSGNNDLGTSAADIVMVLKDVRPTICLAVDKNMLAVPVLANIPSSGLASLAAIVSQAVVTTTASGTLGVRQEATCLSTTDGHYFVYQVLAVE